MKTRRVESSRFLIFSLCSIRRFVITICVCVCVCVCRLIITYLIIYSTYSSSSLVVAGTWRPERESEKERRWPRWNGERCVQIKIKFVGAKIYFQQAHLGLYTSFSRLGPGAAWHGINKIGVRILTGLVDRDATLLALLQREKRSC